MTAPGREDLDKALSYALENLRLGDEATDPAVRHDRHVQATQAFGNVSRIMAGITAAEAPPQRSPWGMDLNYGGAAPARGVLAGPRPR
jgi:hypothetical protein